MAKLKQAIKGGSRFMQDKYKVCTVCSKDFSKDDDVVVCPECGYPYHRECYNEKGSCVYEEIHCEFFAYDFNHLSLDDENENENKSEDNDKNNDSTDAINLEQNLEDEDLPELWEFNAHGESKLETYNNTFDKVLDIPFNSDEEIDIESDFIRRDIFGVSKLELLAYAQIHPLDGIYSSKNHRIKIINLNVFAAFISPFYQFYKGMRILGITALLAAMNPILSVVCFIAILLFNDYIHLRSRAAKIRRIRSYYARIAKTAPVEISYYDFLRFKGGPSIARGILEPIIVLLTLMVILNFASIPLSSDFFLL